MKMLIKNGTVYQAGKFTDEDILIENGKIKALGKDLADLTDNIDETVDASGLLVAPGLQTFTFIIANLVLRTRKRLKRAAWQLRMADIRLFARCQTSIPFRIRLKSFSTCWI